MTLVTPNRRTVIRTAAWSVPAVAVATAAPAFAVSPAIPGPNLSTTADLTGTRDGSRVTLPAPILVNTGDEDTDGLVMEFRFSAPITQFRYTVVYTGPVLHDPAGYVEISPTNPAGLTSFTVNVPADFFGNNVDAGSTMNFTANHVFDFVDSDPVDIDLEVTAANGGIPWVTSLTV